MKNQIGLTLVLILVAATGGWGASQIGLPMPYMLGGLGLVAAVVLAMPGALFQAYDFPEPLRRGFVALVGALIGAGFSPALFSALGTVWISFLAVILFIGIAQTVNFVLYRRIAGYDRATAFYAAMPGGLVEAAILGEAAGGDARILTIQHFVRITLTILLVPLLFLAISGEAVGSSAGQTLDPTDPNLWDIGVIGFIALAGLSLGNYVRIPAKHFILPLLLSAGLHAGGIVETAPPGWLIESAQVVIGASLGARFAGVTPGLLARAFGMGLLSVSVMLMIGAGFALVLSHLIAEPIPILFISFAPGGVTEMSLIALSLSANPVFVSAHHLFRITVTVFVSGLLARAFGVGVTPK